MSRLRLLRHFLTAPVGGAGTLASPTLGYPSPLAANPTSVSISIPADWQTGDVLKLARSTTAAMTSPTLLTHTLTDADITAGTISIGLSGITLSGITYLQAYGSHAGADSAFLSNVVSWGDTVAPTITTSATQSITDTSQLAVPLTATDAGGIASWAISGGVDRLQFQIVGATLEWYGNGSQIYSSPNNYPPNSANPYNVTVSATDYGGNSSTQAIAVSVTQIDQTPDAYSFTNVTNATHSTVYTSNTVTISGLQAGFQISSTFSGPGSYSKNGGAYVSTTPLTAQNGDTFTLRATSGSADNMSLTLGLNIGTSSALWSVATPGSSATLVTGTGSTGAGVNRSRFINATSYQGIVNAAIGERVCVRANAFAANTKFQVEVFLSYQGTGQTIQIGFDDGTADLDNTTGYITGAQVPGNTSGPPGFMMDMTQGGTAIGTNINGGGTFTGGFTALANGQRITFDVDTVAHTVLIKQNGATIATLTLTSQIPTNWYFLLGGRNGNGTAATSDSPTVNFGASAWTDTPPAGYSYYA